MPSTESMSSHTAGLPALHAVRYRMADGTRTQTDWMTRQTAEHVLDVLTTQGATEAKIVRNESTSVIAMLREAETDARAWLGVRIHEAEQTAERLDADLVTGKLSVADRTSAYVERAEARREVSVLREVRDMLADVGLTARA